MFSILSICDNPKRQGTQNYGSIACAIAAAICLQQYALLIIFCPTLPIAQQSTPPNPPSTSPVPDTKPGGSLG